MTKGTLFFFLATDDYLSTQPKPGNPPSSDRDSKESVTGLCSVSNKDIKNEGEEPGDSLQIVYCCTTTFLMFRRNLIDLGKSDQGAERKYRSIGPP